MSRRRPTNHILVLQVKGTTFPCMIFVEVERVPASIAAELARWNCHLKPRISEELDAWMEEMADEQGDDFDEGAIPEDGVVSKIYLLNV